MRRWLIRGGIVILVALAITGTVLGFRYLAKPPEVPEGFIDTNGQMDADEVFIAPEVPGRVIGVYTKEGETIEPGQLVAVIDKEKIQARYDQASAMVLAAASQVVRAQNEILAIEAQKTRILRDYERAENLFREGAIAERNYDEALAAKRMVLARLDATKAMLDGAKEQLRRAEAGKAEATSYLGDTRVISPTTGFVLAKLVEQGEVVQAGTPLFVAIDLNQTYLKVFLPQAEVNLIKVGDEARIYVDAMPQEPFPAYVSYISQRAEFTPKFVETKEQRESLVFEVRLRPRKPTAQLKPGMPAEARIQWKEGIPFIEKHPKSQS